MGQRFSTSNMAGSLQYGMPGNPISYPETNSWFFIRVYVTAQVNQAATWGITILRVKYFRALSSFLRKFISAIHLFISLELIGSNLNMSCYYVNMIVNCKHWHCCLIPLSQSSSDTVFAVTMHHWIFIAVELSFVGNIM
jgi:hypothetical protein